MTDDGRRVEAAGPPWSVDLVADLHAGALDDATARRLWPQVQADPEARAVIDALEATRTDLANLRSAPAPPMPADVAARIESALAREAGIAPVVSLDTARRKRNRRVGWISGVVAVAAAAIAAVAIAVPKTAGTSGQPVAAPPPPSAGAPNAPGGPNGSGGPLALRSDNPQAAVGQLSSGVKDYGPLGSADKLNSCLQAAGFAPTSSPIGVRPGTVDGQPAVLVLLPTGHLAEFRVVALSPQCGPKPLLDKVVGK